MRNGSDTSTSRRDDASTRSDTGPGFRTPGFEKSSNVVFLTIFGRTDLRISLSKAKIEPEADFDVRFAVARQNPGQISKKRKFRSEIFAENFFCGVEKRNVWNRLKRVLAKFRADPSHVRGFPAPRFPKPRSRIRPMDRPLFSPVPDEP